MVRRNWPLSRSEILLVPPDFKFPYRKWIPIKRFIYALFGSAEKHRRLIMPQTRFNRMVLYQYKRIIDPTPATSSNTPLTPPPCPFAFNRHFYPDPRIRVFHSPFIPQSDRQLPDWPPSYCIENGCGWTTWRIQISSPGLWTRQMGKIA
jgi:hypothetical protein